jgi:hypothetical protein
MSQSAQSPARTIAHAAAKLDVRKALRVLQTEMRRRFGQKATSYVGQNTLYLSPDRIELVNEESVIVARGHARVATVLVRRRRKKK